MTVRTPDPLNRGAASATIARQSLLDVLMLRLEMSAKAYGLVVVLGCFFVFLSRRPLWHTDLWGHLAYGRFIASHGGLPRTEPFLPLARGVPFVDLAWLSEIVAYLAYSAGGIPSIQFLYALAVTTILAVLAGALLRRTRSLAASLLGMAACAWVERPAFEIVRPQLAGVCCYVLLFGCLMRGRGGRRWILVPALFAIWPNLHGSFAAGLGLLAAVAAGRAFDVVRRARTPRALLHDRKLRQATLLVVLAGAAVGANPYGWNVYRDAWNLASNPNLNDLVEWQPLAPWMRQARAAAVISAALVGLYFITPRRVSSAELLILAGLGVAACWKSRMIVWWAPVAGSWLAIHAHAAWKRFRRRGRPVREDLAARAGPAWFVAAVVTAIAVAFETPLGGAILGQPEADPHQSLSADTPIDAAAFLRAHPPRGQVFNAYEWGDYLLWAGPPDLQVFVASHAHLVPRQVWRDYMTVIDLGDDWESILGRYAVNTTILDRDNQEDLVAALRSSRTWSVKYEDRQAVVFVRRTP